MADLLVALADDASRVLDICPRIEQYVIRGAYLAPTIRSSTTSLPPPIVYWLCTAVCPSEFFRRQAALYLAHLESLLGELENTKRITGSWQSRVSKLRPPRLSRLTTHERRFGHFDDYQSSIFELYLASRLAQGGYTVEVVPDSAKGNTPDLVVKDAKSIGVCAVEGYAPRKGVEEDYRQLEADWQISLGIKERAVDQGAQRRPKDFAIPNTAVPDQLRALLHDSNFDVKLRQLAYLELPTVLAVRLYGLTQDYSHLIPHHLGADRHAFVQELFETLPQQCSACCSAGSTRCFPGPQE